LVERYHFVYLEDGDITVTVSFDVILRSLVERYHFVYLEDGDVTVLHEASEYLYRQSP
jgi:hypothetical protein